MALLPDSIPASPVLLRRWDETDLAGVMAAIEQSIDDLQMWMPWAADGVPSVEVERAVFRAGATDFDRDDDWSYVMIEIASGDVVGGCGLHHRRADEAIVEIGYWVRSDRHGRGYATAAARRLTDTAFELLSHVAEVQIRMDEANVASQRVPEKLGYRRGATELRDVLAPGHTGTGLVWSTTRTQWKARRN